MKTTIKTKTKRISTALACAGLIALVIVPAARAEDYDPFTSDIFEPTFSVCTVAHPCNVLPGGVDEEGNALWPQDDEGNFLGVDYASTLEAGAAPTLAIRFERSPNHCPGFTSTCGSGQIYVEQNLRKMAIHLPPGLLGDVNAAPYCGPEQRWMTGGNQAGERFRWTCRDTEAFVGAGVIYSSMCYGQSSAGSIYCNPGYPARPGTAASFRAFLYNARPRPGEQARLVLLPADGALDTSHDPFVYLANRNNPRGFARIDIGVTARPDMTLDAVADEIPDPVMDIKRSAGDESCTTGWEPSCPVQWIGVAEVFDILLLLNGSTGADRGHPFLSNPTFCDPQAVEAELQGYAQNARRKKYPAYFEAERYASGVGATLLSSAPYRATGCEAVPYAPTFTGKADTEAPGAAAALSTVITQKDDEATTKKVHVVFPKGMGVNIASSLTPCPAADLAAKSCPDSAKMGTASAESRLLPKRDILGDSVKPEDEVLTGSAYLTGLKGNELSLSILLSGFVDVQLNATAGVAADGTLTATFNDLPSLPYNRFTLNLFGGERSLLQNPRRCGTQKTTATFTSHSGKVHTTESASEITGCNKPTFDAELTEPGKGKPTGLELEVRSDEKPIKEVKFGIDRNMKLSTKGLGKKRKFGEVSATSASGTEEAALKRPVGVRQKKGKAFSLRTSALKGLGVNIYRTRFARKGIKTFKRARNRKNKVLKKKTVPKNRVSVKQLPRDDLTKVAVSLNPDETKLLRNHADGKTCHARFLALVKTEDGTKYALKQKLRLRGKGCGKKKSSKK